MGKNDGGFRDNPFGGLFDFDRDGKEDFAEQGIGFGILEEIDGQEDLADDTDDYDLDDDLDVSSDEFTDYSWREYCEDGADWNIDPEDYETEEEYEEALDEAKLVWREHCKDGENYDHDPEDHERVTEYTGALAETSDENFLNITLEFSFESSEREAKTVNEADYPNKRRYNAAYALANKFSYCVDEECEEKIRCQFILEKADSILAADYLSYSAGFLYAQAVKDNFTLPLSLPDEDEARELEFVQIVCKIAKRDIPLSFEVWSWCLEQFLPYAQYDEHAAYQMTNSVIDGLYNFPDNYKTEIVRYMDGNHNFRQKVVCSSPELADALPKLVSAAIQERLLQTADALFADGLDKAGDRWREINTLTKGVIDWCKDEDELESMEYFRDHMLPLVKAIDLGMVQDEVEEWEKDIAEYIDRVERRSEGYAFTRRNAWRANVPGGEKYNLSPRDYDTETEYLEALNKAKYGWRKWYEDKDNLGLDPHRFEMREEFREALKTRKFENRQRHPQTSEYPADPAALDDEAVYTYCGVAFPHSARAYHYRTENMTIKIGDIVTVPVGSGEARGSVVSVGQYKRMYVPFPIEKTKFILHKNEE